FFFFSSRRRHTRFSRDWSSDVCSSDLAGVFLPTGKFCHTSQNTIGTDNKFCTISVFGGSDYFFSFPAFDRFQLFSFKNFCSFRRSEERRVGKECRAQWSPYRDKKKVQN